VKAAPEQSNRLEPSQILDLFKQSQSAEARVTTPDKWKKVREIFIREMTFQGVPGLEKCVGHGEKYSFLLDLLKRSGNSDTIWYILANWLQSEGICTPEKLLPEDVFRRITQAARKKLAKLSWTDYYYTDLIRAWLPYSQALLQGIKALNPRELEKLAGQLRELGDEADSIRLATRRRRPSAVTLTCAWLADRGVVRPAKRRKDPDPVRTLRNAYSRLCGSGAPRPLRCAFCEKSAISEFRAQDLTSALHCEKHTPEGLPTSPDEPWRDRKRRRWWRSGTEIRYLAAESESSS
jgi:hypothetical protein